MAVKLMKEIPTDGTMVTISGIKGRGFIEYDGKTYEIKCSEPDPTKRVVPASSTVDDATTGGTDGTTPAITTGITGGGKSYPPSGSNTGNGGGGGSGGGGTATCGKPADCEGKIVYSGKWVKSVAHTAQFVEDYDGFPDISEEIVHVCYDRNGDVASLHTDHDYNSGFKNGWYGYTYSREAIAICKDEMVKSEKTRTGLFAYGFDDLEGIEQTKQTTSPNGCKACLELVDVVSKDQALAEGDTFFDTWDEDNPVEDPTYIGRYQMRQYACRAEEPSDTEDLEAAGYGRDESRVGNGGCTSCDSDQCGYGSEDSEG